MPPHSFLKGVVNLNAIYGHRHTALKANSKLSQVIFIIQ